MSFLPATPPYEEEYTHSRKTTPHRSPSSISSLSDHSLIFQLNTNVCKVIGGGPPSLLFNLRQRVSHARTLSHHLHPYSRRSSTLSLIHLPHRQQDPKKPVTPPTSPIPHKTIPSTVGRPSKSKGPCQACHEASDGCMRKAYHWPFPTQHVFYDKGRPYVYLCNKCGLR